MPTRTIHTFYKSRFCHINETQPICLQLLCFLILLLVCKILLLYKIPYYFHTVHLAYTCYLQIFLFLPDQMLLLLLRHLYLTLFLLYFLFDFLACLYFPHHLPLLFLYILNLIPILRLNPIRSVYFHHVAYVHLEVPQIQMLRTQLSQSHLQNFPHLVLFQLYSPFDLLMS